MSANSPRVEVSPGPDNSSQLENQFEASSNLVDLRDQHTPEPGTDQEAPNEALAVAKGLTVAHESGKSYTADSAEAAIKEGKCTYLGSMSLSRANVLFKLEAMGQAKMAEKSERPIPSPKSDNNHKPKEKVEAPAKEQAVQKEQPLSVESVQTALAEPERASAAPIRAELTKSTIESVAEGSLEAAKISDLAAAIALNRTNFLHAEASTEPNHQEVVIEPKPVLAPRQLSKAAAPVRQVEAAATQLEVEPAKTPRVSVIEAIDWPESSEDDEPAAEQALPTLAAFDLVEGDLNSGEALLPLDPIVVVEGLIDYSFDQATIDELADSRPVGDELLFVPADAESSVIDDGAAVETTSLLTSVLPEAVQATLDGLMESAEPAQVVKIEDMRGLIVDAIDQLRELSASEIAEPKKIVAIERLIEERYRELLQALDITIDEVEFKRFIVQLQEALTEVLAAEARRAGLDEGTHEHKQNFGSVAHALSDTLTQSLQHIKLARFMIQASMV